jgi:branched-chain amino acid transport system permease protein
MPFGPHLLLATLEGLVNSAVLALTALGLSLVFGVMRVVNVAHGEFYMLGAVIAWWVTSVITGHPALGFVAALIVAPLIVGAIALASERLVLRRLEYSPEATIVATIGLLYILQQLALSLYGPEARPVQAPFNYRVLLPWFGYSGYKLSVIVRPDEDPHRPGHARDAVRPRNGAGLRDPGRPRLCRRVRFGSDASGGGGGADRPDQPGALSDGP